MELNFSKEGFLIPNQGIEVVEIVFQKYFVTDFENENRLVLFEGYQKYVNAIKTHIKTFSIWVNGSFVSMKRVPNDIDFVVFIDYLEFKEHEPFLKELREEYLKSEYNLDVYYVVTYPDTHKNYFWYQSKQVEWTNLFTKTKLNKRSSKRFKKGFLKINYNGES